MNLNGLKGAAAYQTYLRVIFYLRLVRESLDTNGKKFDQVLDEFLALDEKGKKSVFIELMAISPIDDRDVLRLCAVHSDANGIDYSKMNIENLGGGEILDLCLKTLNGCTNQGDDLFF